MRRIHPKIRGPLCCAYLYRHRPFAADCYYLTSQHAAQQQQQHHHFSSSFIAAIPLQPTKQRTRRVLSYPEQQPAIVTRLSSGAGTLKMSNQEDTSSMEPALSDEQKAILDLVVHNGKSLFFTGSAGTGKSVLLRAIISALQGKYGAKRDLAVCASTGIAAQNIGGTTIHAWGAVTPGMYDIGKLISFIKTSRPALQRWKKVKTLIIDEVSMVDGRLFDTLATLACELRKKPHLPFGGIQLVVTGDFFQLPPVTRSGEDMFFAFQSEAWRQCIQHHVMLSRVFRQRDDRFVTLLNEMRKGWISPSAAQILGSLSRPLPEHNGLLPTELFPLRAEVDRANAVRMAALPGSVRRFVALDSGPAPQDKRRRLLDNILAPAVLALKFGAQVMLVKNMNETLVNGSVGKVLGFCPAPPDAKKSKQYDPATMWPLVEFDTFRGKQKMVIIPEEFHAEDSEGFVLAKRVQVGIGLFSLFLPAVRLC